MPEERLRITDSEARSGKGPRKNATTSALRLEPEETLTVEQPGPQMLPKCDRLEIRTESGSRVIDREGKAGLKCISS